MTGRHPVAVASLLLALLSCRSEPASVLEPPRPLADPLPVGRMVVSVSSPPLSVAQQALLRRHRVGGVLRQSALDWLEARGRFDPAGAYAVEVQIRSVRLRGAWVALLLGRAAGEDHLEASVRLTRAGQLVNEFSSRVASSAGGRDWKDPAERLQRMARILGRRIAEGL